MVSLPAAELPAHELPHDLGHVGAGEEVVGAALHARLRALGLNGLEELTAVADDAGVEEDLGYLAAARAFRDGHGDPLPGGDGAARLARGREVAPGEGARTHEQAADHQEHEGDLGPATARTAGPLATGMRAGVSGSATGRADAPLRDPSRIARPAVGRGGPPRATRVTAADGPGAATRGLGREVRSVAGRVVRHQGPNLLGRPARPAGTGTPPPCRRARASSARRTPAHEGYAWPPWTRGARRQTPEEGRRKPRPPSPAP